MAHIRNVSNLQPGHLERDLAAMRDVDVQAQEICQKAAQHALLELQRIGVTEKNVHAMLQSLARLGALISAEAARRGLTIVDL